MKKTDYGEVAARYDDNEDRHRIVVDPRLRRLLDAGVRGATQRRTVLDLACGTGNWLAVQTAALSDRDVAWHGLDASDAMLARARQKLRDVELVIGRAEQLPYPEAMFDYLIVNFAFHHFEDKSQVLDEMVRVLRPGGEIAIVNIAPTQMPLWWLYRRFWQAQPDDEGRFWSPARLFHELDARGLEPIVRIDHELSYLPLAKIAADIERRELSQLAILDDGAYERGLARVRADLAADPHAREITEVALLCCTARPRARERPRPA